MPDQLDIDVVKGLVLPRDPLCQYVVDEPIEIRDGFLFLLLCLLFNLLILTGRRGWLLDGDKLFKLFQLLFEVILPSIVTLKFDRVNRIL